MNKYLLIFCLLLLPAFAQAAESPLLNVDVDHGVSLTLSAPAASVFIANPDIADIQVMSPTSIMVFGKRTGETTFMVTDLAGNTLSQRTVNVTQDLSTLRRELATAIPGNRIHVDSLPNGIVLTGEAHDPASVADAYKIALRYLPSGGDIINRVKVSGSNQIQLRVRFAEVEHNIDNELGFNWQNLATVGGFTFGLATGISGLVGGTGILGNRPNNTDLSLPNDVIGFSRSGKGFDVNGLIDALAQDGLITILAEPNLTAMSGETANFLAGGEFPIPVPQGNQAISIQFKDYGISLEFTPTIIGDDRISLHVKPEVSQLTTTGSVTIDNIAVPALLTRKAETTIEVASGQSFAIAGLLDNSQAQTVNKYPLLGDLPVLGALFRDSRFQNGQTELVIIITPYVVKPSSQQLALPTDGLVPPNEQERLLGLRYSGEDPTRRPQSGQPTAKMLEPPALPIPPMPASALMPGDAGPAEPLTPASAPVASVAPQTAPVTVATPIMLPPATVKRVANPVTQPSEPAPAVAAAMPDDPAPAPVPAAAPAHVAAKAVPVPTVSSSAAHDSPTNLSPAGPGGFVLE